MNARQEAAKKMIDEKPSKEDSTDKKPVVDEKKKGEEIMADDSMRVIMPETPEFKGLEIGAKVPLEGSIVSKSNGKISLDIALPINQMQGKGVMPNPNDIASMLNNNAGAVGGQSAQPTTPPVM